MNVRFIKADSESFKNLEISDGQIIILKDSDYIYYDMGGKRHLATGGAPVDIQYRISVGTMVEETVYNEISGKGAHAEGLGTIASGEGSHAEGCPGFEMNSDSQGRTEASGYGSHSEGGNTKSSGSFSHSEGGITTASGDWSHAEGKYTIASGDGSHSEGVGYTYYVSNVPKYCQVIASGEGSHAGGKGSRAIGNYSFAHGLHAIASKEGDVALGAFPISTQDTAVVFTVGCGKSDTDRRDGVRLIQVSEDVYNLEVPNGSFIGQLIGDVRGNLMGDATGNIKARYHMDDAGGGTISQSICTHSHTTVMSGGTTTITDEDTFRVTAKDGKIYAKSTTISGLDYAEHIYPWYDENVDNEDRTGYFVTVKDNKLYKANLGEYVLGVTSETYGTLGTNELYDQWHRKYKKDNLGRLIQSEEGYYILDDEYDPSQEYVSRENRKEWSAVGIVGQMYVYDDGTCIPGQFCKCTDGGIATAANESDIVKWFVLERSSENTIKILFK